VTRRTAGVKVMVLALMDAWPTATIAEAEAVAREIAGIDIAAERAVPALGGWRRNEARP
jgi:hypothetical protein